MKKIATNYKAIVIGGSAGSFTVVNKILSNIKPNFHYPIVICMHRLKHIRFGLVEGLQLRSNLPVVEPFDKETIEPGKVYLAPSNYHLFIEIDSTISLSAEKVHNHSRPSIDYTFMSAATALRERMVGIILTGANKDGAIGMKEAHDKNAYTIVQDPETCEMQTMPKAALQLFKPDKIMTPQEITDFLNSL